MARKIFSALLICVLSAAFITTIALADKSYSADRFDVQLDLQPGGGMLVTETVVFRFEGGPFTYVFRNLSQSGTDGIQVLDASMDGIAFQPGKDAGQVEISAGYPIQVTWHFSPVSDSAHTFVLRYQVNGVIRTGAADTLSWYAIPEEHEYLIALSNVSINYPAGVRPLTTPSLDRGFDSAPTDQGVRLTVRDISDNESVIVIATFPSGSIAKSTPLWQAEQQQQAHRTKMGIPFGLGAAGITTILGVIGVILAGRSFRRETAISQNNAYQSLSAPPRAIPPALAAKLTGGGVPFLGTLFDLARRGVLRIEEGPKKWGGRSFEVVRQPTSERLQPHEQIFLDALFHKAKNERVSLSELASLAYNGQFSQALDQELTMTGWRDSERNSRRGRFLAAAVLALALGIGVFFAGLLIGGFLQVIDPTAIIAGAILMGSGGAASGVGLAGLIVALLISPLSDEGAQQASAWNSFTGYLRNITRGREPVTSHDLFERYLPYAAGLGLATEWAKFFQKQANIPIPAWFQGLQSGMDDGGIVAIMAAISAADSSASVATGADGGGASGGGASGAG